jgi:hypothetical protein
MTVYDTFPENPTYGWIKYWELDYTCYEQQIVYIENYVLDTCLTTSTNSSQMFFCSKSFIHSTGGN